MYLIYDCTAVSKPVNLKAPFSSTSSWPRLLHLSWIVLNDQFKPIEDFDGIVLADNFKIDEEMMKYAKIDAEDVQKKGVDGDLLLKKFAESVEKVAYIFAHNLALNESILAAEHIRRGLEIPMFRKERFCLMQESTYFCKLPSKIGGYKWPTLSELHIACFHSTYNPLNNARADVIACTRSFIYLMKHKHLEDLFEED